jgi:KipI family sensor histidine kinase inhibitor
MLIVPAGDSAVFVEFADRIDPAINCQVIALARTIEAAHLSGVRDVVSTYGSVAIYFDPLRTDYQALVARISREAERTAVAVVEGAQHRVPVCYDGDCAPDLESVATTSRLSVAEVIALHAGRSYRVFMLGFMPGFAYMGSVDGRIAVPRLAAPRAHVPRGSVGIAGFQTGIYPSESPGGWSIVGRTPVLPFDANRTEPFLFGPGDTVQFYPIDRAEYEQRLAAVV